MIRVVLDTNVLVSANLKAGGLEGMVVALGFNRKIQLCASRAILDEYERVLYYPRLKFDPNEVARFLAALRAVTVVVKPRRILTVSRDEPDNRFLKCAETARAAFLLAGNKRHFPNRWKTTAVVNGREFVGQIGQTVL